MTELLNGVKRDSRSQDEISRSHKYPMGHNGTSDHLARTADPFCLPKLLRI